MLLIMNLGLCTSNSLARPGSRFSEKYRGPRTCAFGDPCSAWCETAQVALNGFEPDERMEAMNGGAGERLRRRRRCSSYPLLTHRPSLFLMHVLKNSKMGFIEKYQRLRWCTYFSLGLKTRVILCAHRYVCMREASFVCSCR